MTMQEPGIVHVPIGGLVAARAPVSLATLLGSCVGLILQDLNARVAVLGHVVRPDGKGAGMGEAYFADRAVPAARDLALRHGAHPRKLLARLAGGGRMSEATMDIGARNVAALQDAIHTLDLTFGGMLRGPRDGGCVLVIDTGSGRAHVRGIGQRRLDDSSWDKLQRDLERT